MSRPWEVMSNLTRMRNSGRTDALISIPKWCKVPACATDGRSDIERPISFLIYKESSSNSKGRSFSRLTRVECGQSCALE